MSGRHRGAELHGSAYRFTRTRGEILPSRWAPGWMATYHPSALLRADDPAAAAAMRAELIADFRRAVEWLTRPAG